MPYGRAALYAPDDVDGDDKLVWLLDQLEPHAATLKALGAEQGRLYLTYVYEGQCNLTFYREWLPRIAALGFDLWVTCYEDPDEFRTSSGPAAEPASAGRPRGSASRTLNQRRRNLRSDSPSAPPLGG